MFIHASECRSNNQRKRRHIVQCIGQKIKSLESAYWKTLTTLILVFVFIVDFLSPNDLVLGFLYLLFLPALVKIRSRRWFWGSIGTSILLTMTATLFGAPPTPGAADWVTWGNRSLTILATLALGIMLDRYLLTMSAQSRAEAALAESEARLRSIVDTAADGIVVADHAGRIVSVNPAALRMFGYRLPEDLIGRELGRLMPLSEAALHDERLAAYRKRPGGGTPARPMGLPGRELRAVRCDGSEFLIEASVGSFIAGSERFFTGLIRDVTERRKAEDLRALLAREVDHRAKNALAVALSLLRLTPRQDAASFATSVEGRVAAMARAHSLLAKQKWTGVELRELVKGELAAYAGRIVLSGGEVQVVHDGVQPVAMLLHELATNATKHGALAEETGWILLSWDFGGQDDGLRLRWAERGGPPVQPPARRGFGTRLLTSLASQQLGGSISYDWAEDGLACTIQLAPRFATQAAPAGAAEPETVAERRFHDGRPGGDRAAEVIATISRPPRVLVVEDEALLALETEEVLQELGCEVVGARTLAEAVNLVAAEATLCLAVLDVNLGAGELSFPVVDLLQTRGVPYIFATGYGSAGSLRGRDHDAVAVLIKPYPREALTEAVASALRNGLAAHQRE